MTTLFGLNIAKIVDDSIVSAGGTNTGILRKATSGTRTPGSLTGGTNPTTVDHSFRGFLDNRTEQRIAGSIVSAGGEVVSIFGNSLPSGVEPENDDVVIIEGTVFTIVEVLARDPAAALYEVKVRR